MNTISSWRLLPFAVLIIFTAPLIIVLSSLLGSYSDNWSHLYEFVLLDYVNSSLILVIGVAFLVFIIGTATAWTVTNYNFIGKNIFEWALILPLSIKYCILSRLKTL